MVQQGHSSDIQSKPLASSSTMQLALPQHLGQCKSSDIAVVRAAGWRGAVEVDGLAVSEADRTEAAASKGALQAATVATEAAAKEEPMVMVEAAMAA